MKIKHLMWGFFVFILIAYFMSIYKSYGAKKEYVATFNQQIQQLEQLIANAPNASHPIKARDEIIAKWKTVGEGIQYCDRTRQCHAWPLQVRAFEALSILTAKAIDTGNMDVLSQEVQKQTEYTRYISFSAQQYMYDRGIVSDLAPLAFLAPRSQYFVQFAQPKYKKLSDIGYIYRLASVATYRGQQVVRNIEQSVEYLKVSYELNNIQAANDLATFYYEQNNLENAYYWSLRCINGCKRSMEVGLTSLEVQLTAPIAQNIQKRV